MSAEVADILLSARKEVFDTLRPLFFDSSVRLHLLKPSDTLNEYEDLWEVTESWFFDNAKGLLYIAEGAQNLAEPMSQATHVKFTTTDGGEQVYVIIPDDTLAPDIIGGTRVSWTIKIEKSFQRASTRPLY